jgi:hypothetical protein
MFVMGDCRPTQSETVMCPPKVRHPPVTSLTFYSGFKGFVATPARITIRQYIGQLTKVHLLAFGPHGLLQLPKNEQGLRFLSWVMASLRA